MEIVRPKTFREKASTAYKAAIVIVSLSRLAACGGGGNEEDSQSGTPVNSAASDASVSSVAAPFEIKHQWSLPPAVQLSPPTLTPELCAQDFWKDEDGKQRPLIQQEPPLGVVDARCSPPLDDNRVGVYRTPQQQGKAPIVVLNGDPLGIECFIEGQVISDVRPGNGSNIWLGVVTANGAGFIPEANSGYIDEHTLQRC